MPNDHPQETSTEKPQTSPTWNWPTKLVVGLALVVLLIWVLVQFQNFLGPIITAFMLTYLFYPIAKFFQDRLKLPWRASVTVTYILVVLIIAGLVTWGGLALVEQIQNLITFIEKNVYELPRLLEEFSQNVYHIGPFEFSFDGFNWNNIADQIVNTVQPILGQLGSIVGSVAGGAVNAVFWGGIMLLVSYFLLAESKGATNRFLKLRIPGYTDDLQKMGLKLNAIWNGFIRGQVVVVVITVTFYTIFLGSMGIQFFFGLALLAAAGHFIPYVGAWITWITYLLVALLQGTTIFNLPPGIYALIIVGVSIIIDSLIDNLLMPKVMAENLKVHPALVLVGAMISLDFLGVVGILVAAPVMATLKLFFEYIMKKLTDQDPWEELEDQEIEERSRWVLFLIALWEKISRWVVDSWRKIGPWIKSLWKKIQTWFMKMTQRKNKKDM